LKWSSRQYLVAFNMAPGIGGRRLLAIQDYFGTLEEAWKATTEDLMKVEGIGPKTAERFCTLRADLSPRAEEAWAKSLGAEIITLYDEEYPTYLRRLAVPPPVLYVQGQLPQELGVAVVGTRKPSRMGVAQARQFSAYLVSQGIPVVSGLARGIDYFAHEQVVQSGGQAIAVLGSHLGSIYPHEHRHLAREIVKNGALITEFSSRCATLPGNFPRRNRVIAACSRGVLVVQAGSKSGALHTADWALEMGIDVWAIPGEITDPLRQGTHKLIKQGAALVTDPTELLSGMEVVRTGRTDAESDLSLEKLLEAGFHPNEIASALDRPISEVLAKTSLYELQRGAGT